MALKQTQHITSDYVLEKVDDYSIFQQYFGDFKLHSKAYNSVFRRDTQASTGFYMSKGGAIIYNDIATGEKLNCFAFVGKMFGLDYKDAVSKVASDFGLLKDGKGIFTISQVRRRDTSELEKKETIFTVDRDKWYPSYLKYWVQYEITEEELEENKVYPVKKLEINGREIPNYNLEMRFCYEIYWDGITYYKIYTPLAKDKKYKWLTNAGLYLPFGLSELPYKNNTLIIQKSQKDRIITKKLHSDVLGIQNESESALRDKTLNFLKNRYDRIVCVFDNDPTGIEAAEKYRERDVEAYYLPVELREGGIKDCGDLVLKHGLNALERWFKKEGIL